MSAKIEKSVGSATMPELQEMAEDRTLTSRLRHLKVGDYLFLSRKLTGTLMSTMLKEHGLEEGSNSAPGSFVLERAFVG
jgi:hypothetical protein